MNLELNIARENCGKFCKTCDALGCWAQQKNILELCLKFWQRNHRGPHVVQGQNPEENLEQTNEKICLLIPALFMIVRGHSVPYGSDHYAGLT